MRWNPAADYWLDVDPFMQQAESNEGVEYSSGYEELTLEQKVSILELYSGDLLPELNSAWLLPIRLQLRDEYLARLDRLVESCDSQADAAAALAAARKAAQTDPYSEAALRRLMMLRHLMNDRSGALRQLDDYLVLLKRSGSARSSEGLFTWYPYCFPAGPIMVLPAFCSLENAYFARPSSNPGNVDYFNRFECFIRR